jgi:sulfate adenylyltransferase
MVEKHYPEGKALLAAFQTYSRYAGPREAVFTAICRKNFGCSHFIVGRDHTGVGNYYGHYDSHRLFDRLGDIGIVPIFFDAMHYCKKCNDYVSRCGHGAKNILTISGTEGREMMRSGIRPPNWFIRKSVSNYIIKSLNRGREVFVE